MMLSMLVLLCFIVAISNAFLFTNLSNRNYRMSPSMMFGKKTATAKKIVINVDGKTIESSEKAVNLRKELQKNKIEVYPLAAKITGNCGGAGICGTCAVQVISGMENINPASKNELKTLAEKKKKPGQRLSCCARVSGPITIKTKPK